MLQALQGCMTTNATATVIPDLIMTMQAINAIIYVITSKRKHQFQTQLL
jgi:hypothetical protein